MALARALALLLLAASAAAEKQADTCQAEGGCEEAAMAQLKVTQRHLQGQNHSALTCECATPPCINMDNICKRKFSNPTCTGGCECGGSCTVPPCGLQNGWRCYTCVPKKGGCGPEIGDDFFKLVYEEYGCCATFDDSVPDKCQGWTLTAPTGTGDSPCPGQPW